MHAVFKGHVTQLRQDELNLLDGGQEAISS